MAKTLPVIRCLHCKHEWERRVGKSKKLTPPPQCANPSCWSRLTKEGEDYEWVSTAGFAYNEAVKNEAKGLKPAKKSTDVNIFDIMRGNMK